MAAWRGRGAFDMQEEPWDLWDRCCNDVCETESAATCLRFPERFKVLKVQVLIIHIICWEKTLRCHQHQSDLLSPLPSHTCNYRGICCRLLSPCLPILPIGGSHFCLAYIQKSLLEKENEVGEEFPIYYWAVKSISKCVLLVYFNLIYCWTYNNCQNKSFVKANKTPLYLREQCCWKTLAAFAFLVLTLSLPPQKSQRKRNPPLQMHPLLKTILGVKIICVP